MYLLDDLGEVINSECSLSQFEGEPCLTIESSGGASPSRGVERRNPDYNKLLGVLFARLAETGTRISRVVLDSSKVSNLSVSERIVKTDVPYPIDFRRIDTEEFRRMLQREVAMMHRDPDAKKSGNAQKRIRICLEKSPGLGKCISTLKGAANQEAELNIPGISETERSYLRSSRLGQGQFRSDLIEKYGCRCPLSGIEHELLLVASHIKPWSVCSNAERLDSNNGILLSAMVDRLFDKGLVSFSEDGSVLVAPSLSKSDRIACAIDSWPKLTLSAESKGYMAYHRLVEFKGE